MNRKQLILWIGLAVAVDLGIHIAAPPRPRPRPLDEQSAAYQRAQHWPDERFLSWLSQWMGTSSPADWLQCLLIAGAGGVTWMAFRSEREAVRLTQRADVLISNVSTSYAGPLRPDTVVIIKFTNFGPTRANNVLLDAWIAPAGMEPTDDTPRPMLPIPAVALGAKDSIPYPFEPIGQDIDGPSLQAISLGHHLLLLGGQLDYDDVFGVHHTVTFGGVWRPNEHLFQMTKNSGD